MRRSVFFMGRAFTRRHINACRSPLLTGYVRPTSLMGSTSTPLLLRNVILGSSVLSAMTVASASDALEGVLSRSMATLLLSRSGTSSLLCALSCIQNLSTCVMAWERVFHAGLALLSQSLVAASEPMLHRWLGGWCHNELKHYHG
ncbi:hypothetical protein TRVL_01666 [Trypanosoma vivax]|uniref:Uncharacterized protein n=1 Tax=Trypanosoma vivax (strain Y486) TaxID=1055687 RepID=G0TY22_TRYVY|nr:hypothetical protein TRVL_01666 [Trypanosoma vivax]CCC48867.1 conserved hypothetical protein, unlikey [Trypanosoma vivax Y486]